MGEKLNKAAQALADDTSFIYYGEVSEKNIDEINALLIRKTI